MPTPAINIPIRPNLDEFKRGMRETSSLATTTTKAIAKRFVDMNAGVLASGGAAGTLALNLRSVIGVLGPLSAGIAAVSGMFKLMGLATELAKEKIEEFNRTAEQAGRVGVSTDFFQRMTESGKQLRLTIDDINAAMERFSQSSAGKLGGSSIDRAISGLTEAGNFRGNTGVGAVASAIGTESKMRAVVALITEALEKGERLAALDLAEKAFGAKIADNLRSNNQYLREMMDTADRIAKAKIVSDEEIGRAIDLKNRLEEAQRVLAEKFKPIQDDLAKLGMNYHESWVGIYQNLANAVSVANQLYAALKEIPDVFARAGASPFWSRFNEFMKARGLLADPESIGVLPVTASEVGGGSQARGKLAGLLSDPNAVRRAMQDAIDVETKVRGDNSRAPTSAAPTERDDPFDRVTGLVRKRTQLLEAEARTIGMSADARERARIVIELETAARKANEQAGLKNTEVTEQQRATINGLADAYAKATANVEALNTPLARLARTAQDSKLQFQELAVNSLGNLENELVGVVTGTKSVEDAFKRMADAIIADLARVAIRQMLIAPLAGALTGGAGSSGGLLSGLLGFADGGAVRGPGTGTSDSIPAMLSNGEFVVNARATAQHRDVLDAINSGRVARFAEGGPVGGEGASAPSPASSSDGAVPSSEAAAPVTINSTLQFNFASAGQANDVDPEKSVAFAKAVERELNSFIKVKINEALINESRNGGLLRPLRGRGWR